MGFPPQSGVQQNLDGAQPYSQVIGCLIQGGLDQRNGVATAPLPQGQFGLQPNDLRIASVGGSQVTNGFCLRGELSLSQPCANCSQCVPGRDRKSTRLNSSHVSISYAVFC